MDSNSLGVTTAYNSPRSTRTSVPSLRSLRCCPTRLGRSRHGEGASSFFDSERGAPIALAGRMERRVESRGGRP